MGGECLCVCVLGGGGVESRTTNGKKEAKKRIDLSIRVRKTQFYFITKQDA